MQVIINNFSIVFNDEEPSDPEEMKLTNAAMLDILEVVRSEECGATSLAPFTASQNCREERVEGNG